MPTRQPIASVLVVSPALPRPLVAVVKFVAVIPGLPLLLVAALLSRPARVRRRRAGNRPRVIWGPDPIISIKHWSRGVRRLGFESRTVVAEVLHINQAEDFDVHRDDMGPSGIWFEPWRDMLVFAWVLRHGDLIVTFFDGGFLRFTALRSAEARLLRLAGIPLIVTHYGGDAAVPGYLDAWEDAMAIDYPDVVARADAIRARVDWFCRRADVVVRNLNPGYIPRWDVLWPNQYALDVTEFAPAIGGEATVDRSSSFTRRTTGPSRGPSICFVLWRRSGGRVWTCNCHCSNVARTSRSVRRYVTLTSSWTRSSSGTGCSPSREWRVGSRSSRAPVGCRATSPSTLPCAKSRSSTLTATTLRDRLRDLVLDPSRRVRLGADGRRYAVRWHSEDAAARTWGLILDAVWTGRPIPTTSEPFPDDVQVVS